MGTRILIVDHHASFRQSLARFLVALDTGCEIVGEADTDELALRQIGRLRPDLAFIEIELPDRSGIATTRCIRNHWPGTAVIALNSHPDEEYRRAALAAGATECIDKLMLVDRLPGVLQAALRSLAADRPVSPATLNNATGATA